MPPKKVTPSKPAAVTPARGRGRGTTGPSQRSTGVGAGGKKPMATGPAPKQGTKMKESKQEAADSKEQQRRAKEEAAACVIQSFIRRYIAVRQLNDVKLKRKEYDDQMERLEKEAFVKLVEMEREKLEKEQEKERTERRRKAEEAKRRKLILEAAFDGDNDEIENILKEVVGLDDKLNVPRDGMGQMLRKKHLLQMVDCTDPNNNTPLSEAANGGHADTIRLLIGRGADPNARGQFQRTPLYRASFSGHVAAIQALLELGGDPRTYSEDGTSPEHVAPNGPVEQILTSWDVGLTDEIINKMAAELERRNQDDEKTKESFAKTLSEEIAQCRRDYDVRQKQLVHAHCELEKRISEHDKCCAEGKMVELTLRVVKDAEVELETARTLSEEALSKLDDANLRLREQRKTTDELVEDRDLPGIKVSIRQLDEVLVRDVGDKIADSGFWPMLIDPSGQAATFLRYQDTNYINALSPANMEPEALRLALLGALRYGKPVVVDMMDVDMYEAVDRRMDEIHEGLLDLIMSKEIVKNDKFKVLMKPEDGEEYHINRFNLSRLENFRFIFVTKQRNPFQKLLETTYPIRIHMPVTDSMLY